MSSEDEGDAVLVEHPKESEEEEAEAEQPDLVEEEDDRGPRAFQIVSIGDKDDAYAFKFHEEKLNEILSQIPPGWHVAVVSVVGAFRTGKSFLLSWFLRYLHHLSIATEGTKSDDSSKWYSQFHSLGNDGFDWKGGHDRNTTGIWMWSQPHFIRKEGDDMAVLLVDTQGMFDHETTMALTASIFGLSTLLSSYQIYNVDKRIQEDNLQQLALFSEYARMALSTEERESQRNLKTEDTKEKAEPKPFQRMEFLVRDWQHFEDDEEDYDTMEQGMKDYLEKVIAEKDAKDLQDTREQIMSCFETLSCYTLPHPGFAVTKKKYSGDVSVLEELFLKLLDRYCTKVFDQKNLEPKVIRGRTLTAAELGAYVKAYAQLFASGASFPEASTMLEATAMANNTNAVSLSLSSYKENMDRIAGPHCSNFVRPEELKEEHTLMIAKSLTVFDSIATFGNRRSIDEARAGLMRQMTERFEVYESLNDSRNPLKGLETYLIPMIVALISFILRWIADFTCSPYSQVCKASSDFLSHIYAVVMCFLLLVAGTRFRQIGDLMKRLKAAFDVVMDNKAKKD